MSVDRERLAAEQAALVRVLVDGGPVPAGFDPDRVRATAAALARKRAHEVARAWPALAAELGDDFTARFLAAAVAGPPRRLVVTVRVPGLGEHWLSAPSARDRTPSRLGCCGLIADVGTHFDPRVMVGGPRRWRQVPPCSRWSR